VDVFTLAKPTITLFALVTAAGGMALGGSIDVTAVKWFGLLLGTTLMVASANTLNMYLERESDCLMARTRKRPLPSGRMEPQIALAAGVGMALLGAPILTFAVNPLTGLLGVIAFIFYVMLYTPLKRRTTISTLIGSVPGAMPALLGYTAATGRVDLAGLTVFGVLFMWQIPHFHAIAFYRRAEYQRAGLKVLPNERGPEMTRLAIMIYLAAQVQLSLLLFPLGVAGKWYTGVATLLGAGYFGYAAVGGRSGGPRWARNLFLISLIYLPLLFGAMVVDSVH
jgi:protoheme IX farnesyltransferase